MKYFRFFDKHSSYITYKNSSEYLLPNIIYCNEEQHSHISEAKSISPDDKLSIRGSLSISGEVCNYMAILNDVTDVTTSVNWSIISGSDYAAINQNNGVVTILNGANNSSVTIQASLESTLVDSINVILTYVAGSTVTTTFNTVTDESGNTYSTTNTITTNSDGTSTQENKILISDENGNVFSGITENTDTSGNIDTQNATYDENGNKKVVGYTIDTENNPNGYKDIGANGLNTEFIPFNSDNEGFECHIIFEAKPSDQPNPPVVVDTEDSGSNYLYNILSAMSPYSPWTGFMIRWGINKSNVASGSLVAQFIGSTKVNCAIASASSSIGVAGFFDLTIAYDPNLSKYSNKVILIDNTASKTLASQDVNIGSNDLDFTIGYAISQAGTPYRYACVKVYDFSVTKI